MTWPTEADVLIVAGRLRGKGMLRGECGQLEHDAVREALRATGEQTPEQAYNAWRRSLRGNPKQAQKQSDTYEAFVAGFEFARTR